MSRMLSPYSWVLENRCLALSPQAASYCYCPTVLYLPVQASESHDHQLSENFSLVYYYILNTYLAIGLVDLCHSSYPLQIWSGPCHILYFLPFQLIPAQLSTTSSHIYLPEGFLWLPVPTELILEEGSLGVSIKPYPTCSQGGIQWWINAPAPGLDDSKARALHWLQSPLEDSSYHIVIIYHFLCLFSLLYLTSHFLIPPNLK